jgi:hypothetical protein
MNLERVPLIATDGFQFYKKVVRRILVPACLYGQVIKTRWNDRIIKVACRYARVFRPCLQGGLRRRSLPLG